MRTEIKKAQQKLDNTGHKVDDWVEDTAEKHNYPKWKVWFGVAIGVLALVGISHVIGWL